MNTYLAEIYESTYHMVNFPVEIHKGLLPHLSCGWETRLSLAPVLIGNMDEYGLPQFPSSLLTTIAKETLSSGPGHLCILGCQPWFRGEKCSRTQPSIEVELKVQSSKEVCWFVDFQPIPSRKKYLKISRSIPKKYQTLANSFLALSDHHLAVSFGDGTDGT